MSTTTMVPKDPGTRDEEFYFEDGSCILRVQDRLFNLHRSILSVNSVFFKQMFSLSQPTGDRSGQSDEDPILCDDSVDDFRALCHILYRNLTEPGPDPGTLDAPAILRIARIASLAHKYEFTGIQNWAHKIMSGSSLAMRTLSLDEVAVTLEVALESSWEDVSTNLKGLLLHYLSQDTDKSSLETASKLSFILNFAERHNYTSLQAEAYHLYLQAIKWTFTFTEPKDLVSAQPLAEIPTSFYNLSALNDAQKLCLFRGFSNLSALKTRLRVPLLFSHNATGCITRGLEDGCNKEIMKKWEEVFFTISGDSGPVEILQIIPEYLTIVKDTVTSPECVEALNHETTALKLKLESALPEYFGLKENTGESMRKLN